MSLHYLLDGYNIIHQVPQFEQGSLEERRNSLVRWVASARPQGSVNNQVTIVFDGNIEYWSNTSSGDVSVVFSQGQNADDCIKNIVEDGRDPKAFVVVSDDKEIKLYTRALGAKTLSVKEFAADLFGQRIKKATGVKTASPIHKVTLSQADMITKEFERLWLK